MKAGSPVVLGGLHISWLKRQNEGSKESGEQGAKVQGGHRAPRVPGVEWWKPDAGVSGNLLASRESTAWELGTPASAL